MKTIADSLPSSRCPEIHELGSSLHILTSEAIYHFYLGNFAFSFGLIILPNFTHSFKLNILKLNQVEFLDYLKFTVILFKLFTFPVSTEVRKQLHE